MKAYDLQSYKSGSEALPWLCSVPFHPFKRPTYFWIKDYLLWPVVVLPFYFSSMGAGAHQTWSKKNCWNHWKSAWIHPEIRKVLTVMKEEERDVLLSFDVLSNIVKYNLTQLLLPTRSKRHFFVSFHFFVCFLTCDKCC